jgi:2-oxo-4-hydroxy-4-carboxy--5-ureidoimidazoline (OHCU) decarboxylase
LKLDAASDNEFIATMTPLFEGAPLFLRRLAAARPFGSVDALFERARDIATAMPEEEQIELVDAHPRLGAAPGLVSALSYAEQGYDRTPEAPSPLAAELEHLNDAYEKRFGFRYCVYVAGRSREALLPDFRAALDADRTAELRRGLLAVVDIARDRYDKLAREAAPR